MIGNKKVSVICGVYIGDRPVQVDEIRDNKLHYVEAQLRYLEKYNDCIHKFYLVVAFENEIYRSEYLNTIKSFESEQVIVYPKDKNVGGSYHSWSVGLELDAGESDLIFLIEDDYVISDRESIELIVKDFDEEPDLFFYCGKWRTTPLNHMGDVVVEHASVSNGVINNELYNTSGIKFKLKHEISRNALFYNQMFFLEPYRLAGFKMKDFTHKYSSLFSDGVNKMVEFGVENGHLIFHPLTKTNHG